MSNTQIVPGTNPTPELSTVATDQVTIFGSGTVRDPLRAAGGTNGNTYTAKGFLPIVTGSALGPANLGAGITVRKAATNAAEAAARCSGIALSTSSPDNVNVQYRGIVVLTEAEWQAITVGGVGLVAGNTYWVADTAAGNPAGQLDSSPPATPGEWATIVGFALTTTELQLQQQAPKLVT